MEIGFAVGFVVSWVMAMWSWLRGWRTKPRRMTFSRRPLLEEMQTPAWREAKGHMLNFLGWITAGLLCFLGLVLTTDAFG